MNIEELLVKEEGEVLHCYDDQFGFKTIGVGVLIDARKGGGITREESRYLLNNRIERRKAGLRSALPWFDALNEVRQAALISMAYQLGMSGLLAFHNMLGMMEADDFGAASISALDSRWARQTPARAMRTAEMIRTGEWA